jgi:hypothetical protein
VAPVRQLLVLPIRAQLLYPDANRAAERLKSMTQEVDAVLLLALADRETLCGTSKALDRQGPGGRGDNGHGHGLCQIDDRAYPEWLKRKLPDGRFCWEVPLENFAFAGSILAAHILRFGDVSLSLSAYNAGLTRVRNALVQCPIEASTEEKRARADAYTTGQDYAADILRRRDAFLGKGEVKHG